MRITKGNFAGSRVFGDEAQRLHDLYVSDGYEYVCVDNQFTGMIHMAGVSAQFDAEFDSYEDALDALKKTTAVVS